MLVLVLVSNSVHGNRTLEQSERRNTINYIFYLSEADFSSAWEVKKLRVATRRVLNARS